MRISIRPVRAIILNIFMIFGIAIVPNFAMALEVSDISNQSIVQEAQPTTQTVEGVATEELSVEPEAESTETAPITSTNTVVEENTTPTEVSDATTVETPTVDATNSGETTTSEETTTDNNTNESTTPDLSIDNQTDLSNKLDSSAETGSAIVTKNTTAGDAISGDALSVATLVNNVNSTVCLDPAKEVAVFTADITGDVNGDIVLQPLIYQSLEEATVNTRPTLTVSLANNDTVKNDLILTATSGDAEVSKNSLAGSAVTGSAQTVANVLNIVNSMVAASESFIGNINIYGNLTGDILIAEDFIPQLLSSNSVSETQDGSSAIIVDAEDTQTIINNISLVAESGTASSLNNSTAGDTISGDAETNLVIFNLSGHDVIASDSILVFVNVLGKWVGFIVDTPTGTTAAAIGSGVESNVLDIPDMELSIINKTQITNNIALISQSGDSTVANNTTAGNSESGDASASANIANVVGCEFGLSRWFGVLFINVFGSWYGSFGIDTPYGDDVVTTIPKETPVTTTARVEGAFIPRAKVLAYYKQPQVQVAQSAVVGIEKPTESKPSVKSARYESVLPINNDAIDLSLLLESIILMSMSLVVIGRILSTKH